jgi:hypothetical protein
VPAARVDEALAVGARLGVALTPLGTVLPAEAGLQLRDADGGLRPLRVRGYDHFGRSGESA